MIVARFGLTCQMSKPRNYAGDVVGRFARKSLETVSVNLYDCGAQKVVLRLNLQSQESRNDQESDEAHPLRSHSQ